MAEIPENSGELTFKHIILAFIKAKNFLLSKWKFLLIVGFIGGVTGVIYVWLKDPEYKAALSFTTEEDKMGAAGGLAGLAAQFGLDIGGTSNVFAGDNILPLIQSRRILQPSLLTVVNVNGKQTSLLNLYLDITKRKEGMAKSEYLKDVKYPETQDPATYGRLQDSMLYEIEDEINKYVLNAGRPDKKVSIFEIDVTSNDENFSKLFADAIVKQVSSFYIENKTKRSRQTVQILQKTADSLRNAYDAALTGRAVLTDINLNPAFMGAQVGIQKKQTDITVLSSAYGEVVKNLEIAKFNLLKETPLITVIDDPQLPLKKIKQGRLMGGLIFAIVFVVLGSIYLFLSAIVKDVKGKENKAPASVTPVQQL